MTGTKLQAVKGVARQSGSGGEGTFHPLRDLDVQEEHKQWKIDAMQTLLPDFWGQKLTSASDSPTFAVAGDGLLQCFCGLLGALLGALQCGWGTLPALTSVTAELGAQGCS